MKNIVCSIIGGPEDCTHSVMAETEKEALDRWHAHFMENHKEIIDNATDEDKKDWMDNHHQVWEAAPEEL